MSKPPKPAYALTDAEQRDHLPSFPRLIGAEDRRARASRTAIVVATHLPSFPRKRESSTGHA